ISIKITRPPISPLFPYTTLFRSPIGRARAAVVGRGRRQAGRLFTDAARFQRGARRLERPADEVGPADRVVQVSTRAQADSDGARSEEHTSELQSLRHLVCRLLLE